MPRLLSKNQNAIRMRKRYCDNPEKYRKLRRENYRKNPAAWMLRSFIHRLKTRYGLTFAAYKALLKKAKGRCAICREKVKLTIDHNHKTGKAREMLCGHCNRGLGLFFESVPNLTNAIKYLRKHNA